MENLKFWNQCNQPPSWALKKIQAGRLKGKSDISPQWRYQVLTEMFGPCGIGWKFTVNKLWTEPGSHDQIFAFAQISLFVKIEEKWSEPIPGTGGSMLVAKEKAGLYSSDEAYKMSVTDALSTACKMLGIAADIYAGFFDGAKYANHTDYANRLIKLIDSDKAVDELNKRYKDSADMIKVFNAELKKKVVDAFAIRKKVILAQRTTTPPIPTPDPVNETSAPQNREEIPSPGEEDLPPIFDEEDPSLRRKRGEPSPRERIIDAKVLLDSASKEQLPSFMNALKKSLDKMPLDDQAVVRTYYENLLKK